jgi:hypothetical protein
MLNQSKTGAFLRAAKLGDNKAVAQMLDEGARIDGLSPDGPLSLANTSALHEAAGAGHLHIVKLLIDRGASVDGGHRSKSFFEYFFGYEIVASNPPLFVAAARGHTEIVELLLDNGASLTNEITQLYYIPVLYPAAVRRDAQMVRTLLARGARLDEPCGAMVNRKVKASERMGGLFVEVGVCPSVVKQLVKETLDGAAPSVCAKCKLVGRGLSRDYFVYSSVTTHAASSGGTGTMHFTLTRSNVIDSRSFFVCQACIEARSRASKPQRPRGLEVDHPKYDLSKELAIAWFEQTHADPSRFPKRAAYGPGRFREVLGPSYGINAVSRGIDLVSAEYFFRGAEASRKVGEKDTNNPT